MTAMLRPLVVLSALVLISPTVAASTYVPLAGSHAQVVAIGVKETDVTIVDCLSLCSLIWHALGAGATLTLRCLDGTNETSTGVWPVSRPQLFHPCIVESTLVLGDSFESVVVWRANLRVDP